ncbi:MAG TPA: lytic transglycosylase domain-containing protein [Caulobacterales bacterium]|nr:lytic transglycosylase domain-containing protein [Caulobacterales bacterium]
MTKHRLALVALCVASASPAFADPRVVALSDQDEAHYRTAFANIESHNWAGVNRALNQVEDESLVGVVKGRMLLSRAYRPSRNELNAWLERYRDLPIAQDVYERAQAMRTRVVGRRRHRHTVMVGSPPPSPTPVAMRQFPGTPPQPPGDSASVRVQISRIADYVGAGDDSDAKALGEVAAQGPREGQADWWLGIVAYRQHDYAEAIRRFEASAQWPYHGAWAASAAHYWAARSRLAAGEHEGVVLHLEAAAASPWTFYGQLAEAQLGRDSAMNFTPPELDQIEAHRFLERHQGARRAAALAQLGRLSEVEGEMRRLHAQLDPNEDRTYLALAIALQAPSAQLRAAEYGGPALAAGYCPSTSFEPDDGFSMDRAVLYGIVRQESYFNPKAVSVTNARGLMQLLASTAHDMDRSKNFRRNPTLLFDPGANMSLGQAYVEWLIDQFHSDGDLGRVFAAYNGGPGWLQRWLAAQPDVSDPLLVMETLSRADSRDYAERVLSHMSLCRKSFGQPTPELDALAAGRPALYQPLDVRRVADGGETHAAP